MTVLHPIPTDTSIGLAPPPAPPAKGTTTAPEPSGWSAPEHVEETTRDYRTRLAVAFAMLAQITIADLILIKSTFNRILRDDEALSWVLGISLTLASVAAAYTAGSYTRKAVAASRYSRADQLIATALILGWATLGAGMFVLRWKSASFAPTAIAYDGAQDTATAEAAKEQLLAIVLAAVYLATGVLAYVDGYKLTNTAAAALRGARARLEDLLPRLQRQVALVARLRENLTAAEHEYSLLPQELATAVASREALAEELKAHSRIQIALHLGDPAATGLVRPAPQDPSPQPADDTPSTEEVTPSTHEEDDSR